MEYWILGIILFIIIAIFITSYICFRMAFYASKSKDFNEDEIHLPDMEIYQKYRGTIEKWMKEVKDIPHEEVTITSFDGLTLRGKFYKYADGAPIELMFHGYRGNANTDLCGGVKRCFKLGCSVLLVDQRTAGKSQGNVISFGVNESRDVESWLNYLNQKFGENAKIILTGISMGAATVLMASGRALPKTVVGVIADCGYTSPKEIIKTVIKQMKLPENLAYPFVKLGAKIYGKFNLEEYSPIEAVARAKVPIIFFHGEADDYVPCEMSRINYEACNSKKWLVTIPNAGHGLAYVVDPDKYLSALKEFYNVVLNDKE